MSKNVKSLKLFNDIESKLNSKPFLLNFNVLLMNFTTSRNRGMKLLGKDVLIYFHLEVEESIIS